MCASYFIWTLDIIGSLNSYALTTDYKVFSWGSYKNLLLGFGKKKETIYAPKLI